MKKMLLFFTSMLVSAFFCNAAGIDGKWKASMEGPNGKMEIAFTFKSSGNTLTGTVSTPMGEMPIVNGKINGNEFSFDLEFDGHQMPHKGSIDGDVIKLKIESPGRPGSGAPDTPGNGGGSPGGPGEMTLKRVTQ